uniref:Uncharacterized protein n=1 Tax=Anguilla anguilla TaxID=7936 RepID=A0A0E9XK22_ANGAN
MNLDLAPEDVGKQPNATNGWENLENLNVKQERRKSSSKKRPMESKLWRGLP